MGCILTLHTSGKKFREAGHLLGKKSWQRGNRRILSILFAKLLLGEKVKLIVDGTILEVANLNRARAQRIKRFSDKAFWGKKKGNLYSEHYKEKVRFEEMYYSVLVMVVCDSEEVE